jgi:hypothetical protein
VITSTTVTKNPTSARNVGAMLLDPGLDLTLRPMRYPMFYDRFRDAIKNTWTVEEVDLHSDLADPAVAGRAAPGLPAGRVLRHRRHDRGQ